MGNAAAHEPWEAYRAYLLLLARVHFPAELRSKLDPADIVQQTLLRAASAWPEHVLREPTAWLRTILAHELADALRHFHRDKRDVDRERQLEADLDQSSSGLAACLALDQSTPSGKVIHQEQLMRLVAALEALPETMRNVVILKHCQQLSLNEVALRVGKSVPAVASYLRRGLEQLRHRLAEYEAPS
jgi:RNA polymerase sigma-70 factor, ECF subfamily